VYEVRIANRPEVGSVPTWDGQAWVAQAPRRSVRQVHTEKLLQVVMGEWRSPDYAAGSAGWAFKPDGSLEANDITARGTMYATAGELENLTVTGVLSLSTAGELRAGADANNGIRFGYLADGYYVRGVNAGVTQFEVRASDGKAYAGGGKVKIDEDGLTLDPIISGFVAGSAIKWGSSLRIYGMTGGLGSSTGIFLGVGTQDSEAEKVSVHHYTAGGTHFSYIELRVDSTADHYLVYTNGGLMVGSPTAYPGVGEIRCQYDLRAGGGAYFGATDVDPGVGDVMYTADLRPVRGGTAYTAYAYVPLPVPYTNSSFDGDSFSDVTTNTKIENTSWSTTIPADAKGLILKVTCRDSGSGGSSPNIKLYPSSTATIPSKTIYFQHAPNDDLIEESVFVPCTEGDIWYRVDATGAGTMDIWLQVWAYLI